MYVHVDLSLICYSCTTANTCTTVNTCSKDYKTSLCSSVHIQLLKLQEQELYHTFNQSFTTIDALVHLTMSYM